MPIELISCEQDVRVDAQADALYGLSPGEFVTARGELVKTLKTDGRKADAAVVAKLPKPSRVAT